MVDPVRTGFLLLQSLRIGCEFASIHWMAILAKVVLSASHLVHWKSVNSCLAY